MLLPMSDDLKRAYGLEIFDRAIQAPRLGVDIDMDQVFRDFLFKLYPDSANNVNKYFKKEALSNPLDDSSVPPMQQQMKGLNSKRE